MLPELRNYLPEEEVKEVVDVVPRSPGCSRKGRSAGSGGHPAPPGNGFPPTEMNEF